MQEGQEAFFLGQQVPTATKLRTFAATVGDEHRVQIGCLLYVMTTPTLPSGGTNSQPILSNHLPHALPSLAVTGVDRCCHPSVLLPWRWVWGTDCLLQLQ